jgi:hypothetical protein
MDFNEVNTAFLREAIAFCLRKQALIIDAGINLSNVTPMADCRY